MSLNKGKSKTRDSASAVFEILMRRFRDDPAGFRQYLPEIAQILDADMPRRLPSTPYHLTERERDRRLGGLKSALDRLEAGTLDSLGAITALEDFATLADDGNVPDALDEPLKRRLFALVAGRAPSTFNAQTELPVSHEDDGQPVHEIALLRGVRLHLTWDMRLVSLSIAPARLRERRQALAFVGSTADEASDVSRDHDRYIGEMSAHGAI